MKGWVLMENGEITTTCSNSIEVFKSKKALFDYYNGTLGDCNTIKRVEIVVIGVVNGNAKRTNI